MQKKAKDKYEQDMRKKDKKKAKKVVVREFSERNHPPVLKAQLLHKLAILSAKLTFCPKRSVTDIRFSHIFCSN